MPKRIIVSTHLRLVDAKGKNDGEYGHIYILDWETKQLLLDPRGYTPDYSLGTPMGKSHGCRGLTVHEGLLYIASSDHKLSKYNLDTLKHIETLEFHPEMKYLHQIKSYKGMLHCVNSGNDSVIRLCNDKIVAKDSVEHETLEPLLPQPPKFKMNPWGEDRIHFNSINWDLDGNEYHTYMNTNCIYNFTEKKIVSPLGSLKAPHDVHFLDNKRLLTSSSGTRETLEINIETQQVKVIQQRDPHPNPSAETVPSDVAMQGFTRGIAISKDIIFACSNPTTITSFDKSYNKLEEFNIGSEPREVIYDLILDPRDWS